MKQAAIRSKAEETTRAAQEIIDAETAARDAKTERLRVAREERDRKEKPRSPKK